MVVLFDSFGLRVCVGVCMYTCDNSYVSLQQKLTKETSKRNLQKRPAQKDLPAQSLT